MVLFEGVDLVIVLAGDFLFDLAEALDTEQWSGDCVGVLSEEIEAAVAVYVVVLVALHLVVVAVSVGRDFEFFLVATCCVDPYDTFAHLDRDVLCTRD